MYVYMGVCMCVYIDIYKILEKEPKYNLEKFTQRLISTSKTFLSGNAAIRRKCRQVPGDTASLILGSAPAPSAVLGAQQAGAQDACGRAAG